MTADLLKKSLRTNAIFSALCAVDLLLFSQPLARSMGDFDPVYLIVLGIGLLGFSVLVLVVSGHRPIRLRMAKLITFMDLSWVLGSVLLIIFGSSWLSGMGLVLVAGVALVVALCAYFQTKGIQQLSQDNPGYGQIEAGRP